MPRKKQPRPARRGFTLIELTVVIAIIAILAGALLPVITEPLRLERTNTMQTQMAEIHAAIVGRREVGDYGYLGNLGAMPTADGGGYLSSLVKTTGAAVSVTNGVVSGWNGPYLQPTTYDPLEDAWGTPYRIDYSTSDNTQWRLQSAGADKQWNTSDDVFLPSTVPPGGGGTAVYWPSKASQLTLTVHQVSGGAVQPLVGYTAALHWTNAGGADQSVNAAAPTNAAGVAQFTGIQVPLGLRWVELTRALSTTFDRTVRLDAEKAVADVYVPTAGASDLATCAVPAGTWNANSGALGAKAMNCTATLHADAGAVVEISFTGDAQRTAGSPAVCYLGLEAISTEGVDPRNAAIQAADAVAAFGAGGGSGDQTVTTTRLIPVGAGVDLSPTVVWRGANASTSCSLSYGVATVRVFPP